MPTTRSRRERGIMPNGESVPCGVTTVTESPTRRPSVGGEVAAEENAGRIVRRRRRQTVERALDEGAADIGDVGSSAGSMPLIVAKPSPCRC